MLLARIACSDPVCDEEREMDVESLAALDEACCCECGHGFVLVGVSELAEPGGRVVSIATRRPQAGAPRRRDSRAA